MSMPGFWEILLIGGVIVLLFGAKKLPGLGGAIGASIKNFKKGLKEGDDEQITSGTEKKSQPSEENKNV